LYAAVELGARVVVPRADWLRITIGILGKNGVDGLGLVRSNAEQMNACTHVWATQTTDVNVRWRKDSRNGNYGYWCACYHLKAMILEHNLLFHSLDVKVARSLFLANTNSLSFVLFDFKKTTDHSEVSRYRRLTFTFLHD
jgi:hypothetical protein